MIASIRNRAAHSSRGAHSRAGTVVNAQVGKDLYDRFDQFCGRYSLTRTGVVAAALEGFMSLPPHLQFMLLSGDAAQFADVVAAAGKQCCDQV